MNKQQGSAHVVITIVLILTLLTALGWIFWQNFIHKEPASKNSEVVVVDKDKNDGAGEKDTNNKNSNVDLVAGSSSKKFLAGIDFQYPSNWTLKSKVTGEFPNEEGTQSKEIITITSPSKGVVVEYGIWYIGGGIGGACADFNSLSSIEYEQLQGMKTIKFVEYIGQSEGRYKFYDGLLSDGTVKNINSKNEHCSMLPGYWVTNLGDNEYLHLSAANMHIKSLEKYADKSKTYDSVEYIKDARKGEEYKDAKAILLSTKESE